MSVQPGEIRFLVTPIKNKFFLGIPTGWEQFGESGFPCRLKALCPEVQKHPSDQGLYNTIYCINSTCLPLAKPLHCSNHIGRLETTAPGQSRQQL